MGKLQQHRIENREPRTHAQAQKPLIEEITCPTKDDVKKNKISLSETVVNNNLNYVLLKQPIDGPPTNLIGLFDMPKGVR